jgi:hypothetical protein
MTACYLNMSYEVRQNDYRKWQILALSSSTTTWSLIILHKTRHYNHLNVLMQKRVCVWDELEQLNAVLIVVYNTHVIQSDYTLCECVLVSALRGDFMWIMLVIIHEHQTLITVIITIVDIHIWPGTHSHSHALSHTGQLFNNNNIKMMKGTKSACCDHKIYIIIFNHARVCYSWDISIFLLFYFTVSLF